MSVRRMPFISSVKLARIDDSYVIPTQLYYEAKKPHIGYDARERCPSPELLVEDFKIELGTTDPDGPVRRLAITENTPRQTPVGLAKDFFEETLRKIDAWLKVQGLVLPTRILIAEPLSLGGTNVATEAWLANYRRSIRKALYGRFAEIDFMPEPFAVFQYYRYGLRHPLVSDNRKHIALVLDFGGGTFDVSVVETTKHGDISGGGVNSRPLGAKSVQVGGFYINRLIAEDMLFSVLGPRVEKSEVRKALIFFYENKNADEDFVSKLSTVQRSFFKNIKLLLQHVEKAKLAVCNSIANWNLAADLSGVAPYAVSVPTNPFEERSQTASVRLDAAKLRKFYEESIWIAKLRETVKSTIERARDEIGGQEISVVLLSGGSSNIRWLRPLLQRDLSSYLTGAQVLELSENFQEIVAKGLATEAARRYYTEGKGDFRAVTYNRLCLMLQSDDGEVERKRFRPMTEALRPGTESPQFEEAVLLPAASSLRGLTGRPLRWKVKLSKPPKKSLSYFFMRSSFDPEDLDSRHNIVDTKVVTPPGTNFQQSIEVELIVREDGTAEPRFLYGQDNQHQGTSAVGKPFYIDMTFAAEEVAGETYLGFDFGTSTSACSFVDSRDIQIIEQRSRSNEWRELSDLVTDLPYPAAGPLARYMSETDQSRRLERGREAVEALLTLAAFLAYTEKCSNSAPSSLFFKNLAHRSAGPLWALLKHCTKERGSFSTALSGITGPAHHQQLDGWISQIANSKHGKTSNIDYVTFLGVLGNHVAKALTDWEFGVFEGVTAKRFSQGKFKGIFRRLSGWSSPFINVIEYEGHLSFSDADVFVVNPKLGKAYKLSPLYLWGLNMHDGREIEPELYEFDAPKVKSFAYKAVQLRDETLIAEGGDFQEVFQLLQAMRARDQEGQMIEGISLGSLDEGYA